MWWERRDLRYNNGVLYLGKQNLLDLAKTSQNPVYAYSADRIRENVSRLESALQSKNFRYRIFYAMKSNRFMPLLTLLRSLEKCGVDVCSPGELLHARQCGFLENEISYTGTSVSNEDLAIILTQKDLYLHLDSISSIKRVGELCPGRTIGIRVNPAMGLGYATNELLRYSGNRPTKFGIYKESFHQALETAAKYNLRVNSIHFHTGCGYLDPQLEQWEEILTGAKWFVNQLDEVHHVNTGGGLGIPLVKDDAPLDLKKWSEVLHRVFGNPDYELWVEPGDYIVKDSGVLLVKVNTVEEKSGVHFVGVNAGFNIHIEPAFYKLPLEPVPVIAKSRELKKTTLAGNINEALDIFYHDFLMEHVDEGEYLAFLNSGGYGAAMSSNHCMRGNFTEYLIW